MRRWPGLLLLLRVLACVHVSKRWQGPQLELPHESNAETLESATTVSHSTAAEQHARAANTHRLLVIASASGCWPSGSAASPSRRSIASGIRCARSTCAARCAAARSLQLVDPLAVYVHRVGDVGHARLEGLPADATRDLQGYQWEKCER